MLGSKPIYATLPAGDLERARRFYAEKLDLHPSESDEGGLLYRCGGGTVFLLYPTQYAGTAQNTAASWDVDDVEATVRALKERGVAFEEYAQEHLKTVDSIATMGTTRAAWFKDSEGNTLAVSQTVSG